MSYRKNTTTLVLKPKKKAGGNTFRNKATMAYLPARNQRSFLNQADVTRGPERKAIDTFTTFAPGLLSAFTTPQVLNLMAQGSSGADRVGRKALIKSVQWRGVFFTNQPACQHRVVVIYDKQANSALPSLTTIFTSNSFTSPLNLSNSDRFVVISDTVTDSALYSYRRALKFACKKVGAINMLRSKCSNSIPGK